MRSFGQLMQLLTIHAQARPLPWRMSSFQALRRDDATWWYCRADSKTSQKTVSLLIKSLVQLNLTTRAWFQVFGVRFWDS
jgi:hypothetical protein